MDSRARRRWVSLPILFLALACAGEVSAQPPPPTPPAPQPLLPPQPQPSTQPPGQPTSDDAQQKINDACEAAYEDAQRAQNADHLLQAKDQYTKCAVETCPKGVRAECAKALPDLQNGIPTVVFDAVDGDGVQVIAAHVSVDGKEVSSSIDGHAVEMDPGPHKVRFQADGQKPVELDVAILAGQQHRTVQGRFGEGGGAKGDRPFGVVPWIVAGSGLVLLGVGIGVLVPGEINIGKADTQCPNRKCPNQAAVDLGQQGIAMATAGKVLVPLGAIALGGGLVWQFVFNTKKPVARVSIDVGPLGGAVTVSTKF